MTVIRVRAEPVKAVSVFDVPLVRDSYVLCTRQVLLSRYDQANEKPYVMHLETV